ncbi:ABC transporter substrate-binding protein [Bacteroidia bacterium]|nr:ABC transporter substrate-binding protein [Bacteroidia bacterium]
MWKVLIGCLLVLNLIVLEATAREVTDMAGRKVSLPVTVNKVFADRFISLMAFALDEKMLCNATFSVPDAGQKYISKAYFDKPLAETNAEEILKLHPDVILLSFLDDDDRETAENWQTKLHIPVLLVRFELPKYREAFAFLGQALNRQTAANQIINFLDTYIISLNEQAKKIAKRPTVYYAEGNLGLNTEAAGSLHSQVIDYLNARNVAQVKTSSIHGMAVVSIEQVLLWQPDVIVAWSGFPAGMDLSKTVKKEFSTREYILSNSVWQQVAAARNKKVHQVPALPFGWIDRPPSVNCLPGVLWLAKQLYPENMTFDLNEALKACFRLFYHVEITDKDVTYLINN